MPRLARTGPGLQIAVGDTRVSPSSSERGPVMRVDVTGRASPKETRRAVRLRRNEISRTHHYVIKASNKLLLLLPQGYPVWPRWEEHLSSAKQRYRSLFSSTSVLPLHRTRSRRRDFGYCGESVYVISERCLHRFSALGTFCTSGILKLLSKRQDNEKKTVLLAGPY